MADNVTVDNNALTDYTVVTDEVTSPYTAATAQAQAVKLLDGTANATTPIAAGGGVEAGALRVTVASDSTGVLSVDDNGGLLSVDDGGGSLTVDGTVTANIGTSGSLALDATLTGGTQKTKIVDSGGTNVATVSAAGAVKVDGSAVTQPVSGTVAVSGAVDTELTTADLDTGAGTDTRAVVGLAGTASGGAALIASGGGTEATALRVTVASDSTGVLSVDDNGATLSVDDGAASLTVDLPAVATGGATPYKLISAATTNATSVKASAGTLYGIQVFNLNAAARYLKLYDKASAPTVGTDTPVKVLMIPGNTAGAGVVVPVATCGLIFSSGIAFALTTGITDADTGAVAASEIVVNLDYK